MLPWSKRCHFVWRERERRGYTLWRANRHAPPCSVTVSRYADDIISLQQSRARARRSQHKDATDSVVRLRERQTTRMDGQINKLIRYRRYAWSDLDFKSRHSLALQSASFVRTSLSAAILNLKFPVQQLI